MILLRPNKVEINLDMQKLFYLKNLFVSIALTFLVLSCKSAKQDFNFIKTELYFGLANDNGTITAAQWNDFKLNMLNKTLSGYTELDVNGFWTDENGTPVSSESKLIIYLNKGSEIDKQKIQKIINQYRTKYMQKSVLQINQPVQAAF